MNVMVAMTFIWLSGIVFGCACIMTQVFKCHQKFKEVCETVHAQINS